MDSKARTILTMQETRGDAISLIHEVSRALWLHGIIPYTNCPSTPHDAASAPIGVRRRSEDIFFLASLSMEKLIITAKCSTMHRCSRVSKNGQYSLSPEETQTLSTLQSNSCRLDSQIVKEASSSGYSAATLHIHAATPLLPSEGRATHSSPRLKMSLKMIGKHCSRNAAYRRTVGLPLHEQSNMRQCSGIAMMPSHQVLESCRDIM